MNTYLNHFSPEFIIFLDVDGVLNSIKWFDFRGSKEGQKRRDYFKKSYKGITAIELHSLDFNCLRILRDIVIETNAKIVISSMWRENASSKHFEFLFKELGVELPYNSIIGCTPVMDEIENKKRGHEIQTYLSDNKLSTPFLIIDDDVNIFLEGQNTFMTNNKVGLVPNDKVLIIEKIKHIKANED
jgi:hypothetical protein